MKLTIKEYKVLGVVIALILTGIAVKAYRTAHPPAMTDQKATR